MENIADKLQSLLSDEEGLKQLQALFDMMSADKNIKEANIQENQSIESCETESGEGEPGFDFSALLKLQSIFGGNNCENKNTALLTALKPHLSVERQERVDKAIKMLNMFEIFTALKESGMLNDIL